MTTHISVNFNHPANRDAIKFLTGSWKTTVQPKSAAPEEVTNPQVTLATHPEMLTWIWSTLPARLPMDCRWVVYGTPVLVHPKSGIIFAIAYGQSLCAMRLSSDDARMAVMDELESECTLEDGETLSGSFAVGKTMISTGA
jgi:hypothetical protein